MRISAVCLLFLACGPITEPTYESPCPDHLEHWYWSYRDTLGVITNRDLCLPAGAADSLLAEVSPGGI